MRSSRREEALTSFPLSPSQGERAGERGPIPPTLLIPLGGQTGIELARSLRSQKLKFTVVQLKEPTRVNVIITTAAITERRSPNRRVRQLRFNPLGPKLSGNEWSSLLEAAKRLLPRASCLILSGSLPRGVPITAYAQLVRLARSAGIKTLLDCDGDALAAAVKARPFLVKPNEHELAQWSGQPLRSESAILRAARDLSEATQGWVLVSRGARRSVLLHQHHAAVFFAQPPRVTPLNTVGAGDALLAAVAWQIGTGAPPENWLRWGVATGTAATQCPAGHLPAYGLIARCLRQMIGSNLTAT